MTEDPQAIQALERQAKMIEDGSENHTLQKEDQDEVQQRYRQAIGEDRAKR